MSDSQGAIAGLNTVDIEGDPIDALDACLMVMETMADVPKSGGGNRPLNMPHDALSVNTVVEPIKIKVYGWKAVEMARNLSFKQLEILREKTQKEHLIPNDRRSDIHVYDQKGLKKLDVLNWAVHHKLIEFKRNPNGSDKPLDTEDQSRVRAEFQRNYEQGLYDSVDGFDSIAFDSVDFDELDVENDPIDALDACLMVLEAMVVRPKNKLNEYIFTASEIREQIKENIDGFWRRVVASGAKESVLDAIRDQGKSYVISRPFNQKGLGHLSEKEQLISQTLKPARDDFFAALDSIDLDSFKERSLSYLKSNPRYSSYGKDFFDFAEKKSPTYFFENGVGAILGDFKSKDLVFDVPDYLQDWHTAKREMIDWLFANVSEAAMRDFAKNSPSDLLEKYGTVESMKAQLMRLPEPESMTDNQSEPAPQPEPTQPAPQIVEHVTGRGKTLRGIVRTDLTKAQAQEIDPYTFKKDGGWFVREKYLDQAQGETVEPQPQANTEPDFTPTASGFVHDDDNAPKPPYNKLQPSFAVEYDQVADIKYDPKESKKLLATALKEAFPGTKFSIKSSYAQYGQGYTVSWIDGPSKGMVDRILAHFISYQDGALDGSMDYRLPGKQRMARNADGKLIDYNIERLRTERKVMPEFAHKLLGGISGSRAKITNPEARGSWVEWRKDPDGDLYVVDYNEYGIPKHSAFSVSVDYDGTAIVSDVNAPGRKRITDHYSDRQYGPATLVKRAKRGDLDAPSTSDTLEPNSTTGSGRDPEQRVTGSNANGSGQPESVAGSTGERLNAGNGVQRDGGTVLPENDGVRGGTSSDPDVSNGSAKRGTGGRANTRVSGGSGSTNGGRSSAVKRRDRTVIQSATTDRTSPDLATTDTQWADAGSIDSSLPYLLPDQRGDVLKAEKRLIEQNKKGILFTNTTGTGKTYTGLGAAKRFINAGQKNILFVTMNDKIARDFIKSAKPMGIKLRQLDGVQDGGQGGAVITTFANMAQNDMLGMIDWDLIVIDEAHNLMQGAAAPTTNSLKKLRALSGHHSGFDEWAGMRHADKKPEPIDTDEKGRPMYDEDEWDAWQKFKKPLKDQWADNWRNQSQKTKVIFLSATPFSYVKTLDWAEGYLFDFVEPEKLDVENDMEGYKYNSGDHREKFYMNNFGYRMRNNRLTAPDAKVDSGVMERAFAEKLKAEGSVSGRSLNVKFDYDRKFILIDSAIGKTIDEGFKHLWETKTPTGQSKYNALAHRLNKSFDYLKRLQLLEALKADAAVDMIKKHISLGRKVLVFHDYNEGGSVNPFILGGSSEGHVIEEYKEFAKERPDLIALKLNLPSPINRLKQAFPDALQFNGRVSKTERSKNADLFNSDSSGQNLMIAQSDAAATGISFHDTTGEFQRVLINIGMPAKPAKLRQTEGRIYRVGQSSDAINRYLTTGTEWERSAFASKIAERAETVDNLSQGEDALVSIKDALVSAYEAADYEEPSASDGIGGKAYDEENIRITKLSPFERAKTHYWAKAKERAKRSERIGKDWYATPEPIGLKMVEWAGAHKGDDVLEPSAGDGAIGRYMPKDASVTFIEPSPELASRATMNNTNANVINGDFEKHDRSNKYDCIVMNPPFGHGGATAEGHVLKAIAHLRNGGRLVALLPVGQMDARLEKMEQRGYMKDMYKVAEITLPSVTFEKAGTGVNTKVTIWQKHERAEDAPDSVIRRDLSHISNISELFEVINNINLPKRPLRPDEALAAYGITVYPDRSRYITSGEGLNNPSINEIVKTWSNKDDGDSYVSKYDRSELYLKLFERAKIEPMYAAS